MSPDPQRPSPSPSDDPASSTDSSAGSEFFADAGPAFDADAPPAPPVVDEAPPDVVAWELETVKGCLTAQGQVLHTAIAKADEEWVYTRDELAAIAPPLTRILNRYDATRAAAATGDEIALLLGLTGYVGRSVQARRAVIRAEREAEEQTLGAPVFGPDERPADFTANGSDPAEPSLPDTPPIPRRGPS